MQITVNATPVEVPTTAGATQYLLVNAGNAPIYLDTSDEVNITTAIVLWSGGSVRVGNPILGEALYAVAENDGADLRVLAIA